MTQITPFSAEYQDTVKDFLLGILEDEQGFVGLPRPDLNDILNTYMRHEGIIEADDPICFEFKL